MDIKEARKKIDEIDEQLTSLFVDRMKLTSEISNYKLKNGMNIRDASRENEIVTSQCVKADDIYAPYIKALYSQIFEMSRRHQSHLRMVSSIEYGLVGADVSNSYTKWIHHGLGNSSFGLYSLPKELIPILFEKKHFKGLCISLPYKSEVIKYCDNIGATAKKTGFINTIVNDNGILTGYNTEYEGMLYAAEKANISFSGKKVIIFGEGSFAAAAESICMDNGASETVTVTRTGKVNYRNYTEHKDAEIMINASHMGMHPDSDMTPADMSIFMNVSGVIDCVYTPVETLLIADAKKRGIPCADGLTIMIERSVKSSELFGFMPEEGDCDALYEELLTFVE